MVYLSYTYKIKTNSGKKFNKIIYNGNCHLYSYLLMRYFYTFNIKRPFIFMWLFF